MQFVHHQLLPFFSHSLSQTYTRTHATSLSLTNTRTFTRALFLPLPILPGKIFPAAGVFRQVGGTSNGDARVQQPIKSLGASDASLGPSLFGLLLLTAGCLVVCNGRREGRRGGGVRWCAHKKFLSSIVEKQERAKLSFSQKEVSWFRG